MAIAQALIMKPKILLLDEPFGALDEATREELQLMLLNLYQENLAGQERKGEPPPHTILIVTHELNEALYVADRVVGLSQYHREGSQGATIVYDKAAPVFHPTDPKEYRATSATAEGGDPRRRCSIPDVCSTTRNTFLSGAIRAGEARKKAQESR